jgi:hypothetical protein
VKEIQRPFRFPAVLSRPNRFSIPNIKFYFEQGVEFYSCFYDQIYENGHRDVIQQGNKPNAWSLAAAAKGGHLALVQWLRANGCPWNYLAISNAALNGHLAVVQWLRQNGCSVDFVPISFAALNGHLDVIKWLREDGILMQL